MPKSKPENDEKKAAGPPGPGRSPPARLTALRSELAERDLDGFIVPHADEHQNEYLAPSSERLAWISGFTGSAGTAVVLADRAAFFTDGRYTLQAEAEVDGALFERRHATDQPATDWIADNLGGGRLGYDPWLHTPNQLAAIEKACRKAGGGLVATEGNPVDSVWRERPPPPAAPIVAHDEAFAGESSADKRRRVAAELTADGVDAVVLSAPDSIAWLLNVRGADVPYSPLPLSFAILYGDGGVDWLVDPAKPAAALDEHLGPQIRSHPPERLGVLLDRLGNEAKTVRLDPATSPAWLFERLAAAGAAVDRGDDPCQLPKARKSAAELDGCRAAHRRDGAALVGFLAWLAETAPNGGVTEMSAADELESRRRGDNRFMGSSFTTISGFGPNGAIVHYRVSPETDRELEPGSLYLVDSGAQYLDGTTDVTRTVAIGRPSDEMRRNFTLVLKGHIALATARFPAGTTGSQLDLLGRRALWDQGLDYDHGTGHGVGSYLGVHEGPHRISKTPSRVALEPGMVVSNEPGYYKSGEYGIRIENLITVVELEPERDGAKAQLGFETLTLAPIDRNLIETVLLSDKELAWVDAYHRRVRDVLTPDLEADTSAWLAAATAPLG